MWCRVPGNASSSSLLSPVPKYVSFFLFLIFLMHYILIIFFPFPQHFPGPPYLSTHPTSCSLSLSLSKKKKISNKQKYNKTKNSKTNTKAHTQKHGVCLVMVKCFQGLPWSAVNTPSWTLYWRKRFFPFPANTN